MDWARGLKRPREEDDPDATMHGEEDNDDDDVSLVSRSPSPPPTAMDVDMTDMTKYDEYVSGYIQAEPVTVDTKINAQNKGFLMLSKLGWKEGTPLGMSSEGRVDPIPFQIKNDATGIGKMNQDFRMIEETVSQRRELDSVRQHRETDEQRKTREDAVARTSTLQSELSTTLKAFYCSLCDKQFQTVAQYDEHTNSYAHHHKARFKDMQASSRRVKDHAEMDRIKEKERKREEKELRKIAAAAGIKMTKQQPSSSAESSSMPAVANKSGGFKKTGWASISSSSTAPPMPPAPPPPPPPEEPRQPAPAFKTGGWTSLDTTPAPPQSVPPPPPPQSAPPPPPTVPIPQPVAPAPTRSSWQQFQKQGSKRR